MNGTAVMTGLAALAFTRAEGLSRLASRLTAMASLGVLGNPAHFNARLFAAKPHPGQMRIAARIRADLEKLNGHAPSPSAGSLFDPLRAACDRRPWKTCCRNFAP